MFETHKIDAFFSGEKNLLDEEENIFTTRRMKVVRFFRLFLPCLTALLLGLGVVLFDFQTSAENPVTIASDDKVYFEKFRIKNTVFEITELDNQFSALTAETIEEVSAGKKLFDLVKPTAKTIDNGKTITLVSEIGQYNQKTQNIFLQHNVVANYDNQMEIHTNSAHYNFKSTIGYGNEKIVGDGERGYFEADKFTFDKKNGEITLIGNVFMKNDTVELRTDEKAKFFSNNNKFVADFATVKKGKDTLYGDIVTAYFKDSKNFEIDTINSEGNTKIVTENKTAYADRSEFFANNGLIKLFDNVKIIDPNGYIATADMGVYNRDAQTFTLEKNVKIKKGTNIVTAPKAIYFQKKDEFRFYDNVKVSQDGTVATAKSGVYYIKKNIAELEKDVVITKDGNIVRGQKAVSDFNTSISTLIANKGGRISGKLIEKTLKK